MPQSPHTTCTSFCYTKCGKNKMTGTWTRKPFVFTQMLQPLSFLNTSYPFHCPLSLPDVNLIGWSIEDMYLIILYPVSVYIVWYYLDWSDSFGPDPERCIFCQILTGLNFSWGQWSQTSLAHDRIGTLIPHFPFFLFCSFSPFIFYSHFLHLFSAILHLADLVQQNGTLAAFVCFDKMINKNCYNVSTSHFITQWLSSPSVIWGW